jgi:hypothetical protein
MRNESPGVVCACAEKRLDHLRGVTRDHSYKLLMHYSRIDIRKYFFSQRILPIWNSLAATEVDLCDLQACRSLIARHNLNDFV